MWSLSSFSYLNALIENYSFNAQNSKFNFIHTNVTSKESVSAEEISTFFDTSIENYFVHMTSYPNSMYYLEVSNVDEISHFKTENNVYEAQLLLLNEIGYLAPNNSTEDTWTYNQFNSIFLYRLYHLPNDFRQPEHIPIFISEEMANELNTDLGFTSLENLLGLDILLNSNSEQTYIIANIIKENAGNDAYLRLLYGDVYAVAPYIQNYLNDATLSFCVDSQVSYSTLRYDIDKVIKSAWLSDDDAVNVYVDDLNNTIPLLNTNMQKYLMNENYLNIHPYVKYIVAVLLVINFYMFSYFFNRSLALPKCYSVRYAKFLLLLICIATCFYGLAPYLFAFNNLGVSMYFPSLHILTLLLLNLITIFIYFNSKKRKNYEVVFRL